MNKKRKKILLLDNYDSFTYNLAHYLLQSEEISLEIYRNDQISCTQIAKNDYTGIVLSPGPKRPSDAGILMQVVERLGDKIPMLGVCLGMQAIGEVWGAKLVKAQIPMHGKTSLIQHNNTGIFAGLDNPMEVMRYHSLILENLPNELEAIAYTLQSKELMAIRHKSYELWAVQFHPESIGSPNGLQLVKNWLKNVKVG